jgi:hypothetical protein
VVGRKGISQVGNLSLFPVSVELESDLITFESSTVKVISVFRSIYNGAIVFKVAWGALDKG